MLTNLYKELTSDLTSNGLSIDDIKAVVLGNYNINIENFLNVAKTYNYDSGYGCAEVPMDLMIIGDTWWLERAEYDGSEWWVYKEQPTIPTESRAVDKLLRVVYE